MSEKSRFGDVGFGLEHLGTLCLKAPRLSAAILLALAILGVIGTLQVRIQDNLSGFFASERAEFVKFDTVRKLFRESENDVGIIAQADDLLTRERLEALRETHLGVSLVDGVASVFSPYSVRTTPDAQGRSNALFPDPLPEGEAFSAFREELTRHHLVANRMITRDRTHMLIIAALDTEVDRPRKELLQDLREQAEAAVEGTGIRIHLAGVPVVQQQVTAAIVHDRVMFNIAGFFVGALISFLFLGRLRYVLLTCSAPAASVFFALGIMGFFDITMDALSSVLPALVMVLAFADSMHLVFAIRQRVDAGEPVDEATARSVRGVGQACVLSSLTTAVALVTIALTSSEIIRHFGLVAATGAVLAYVSVMTVVPTLAVLLLKPGKGAGRRGFATRWVASIGRWCDALVHRIAAAPGTIVIVALVLAIAGLAAASTLSPRYQLAAYLPDNASARDTTQRLDEQFGGFMDILAVVRWQGEDQEALGTAIKAVGAVHKVFDEHPAVSNTWSIESLRQWIAGGSQPGGEVALAEWLAVLERHWLDRLVSPFESAALVAGRIPNMESAEIRAIADDLQARAQAAVEGLPGVSVEITGISTMSARESAPMIETLTRNLAIAVVVVIVLLGVSFRSFALGVYSFLPNILPVAAGGAALWLGGFGLTYETVIAMTLAFGIAVDDTIHFLFHYRTRLAQGDGQQVRLTMGYIGPILVVTTAVLCAGIAVTFLSEMPSLRFFGAMTIFVMVMALLADLVVLPALLIWIRRWKRDGQGEVE